MLSGHGYQGRKLSMFNFPGIRPDNCQVHYFYYVCGAMLIKRIRLQGSLENQVKMMSLLLPAVHNVVCH